MSSQLFRSRRGAALTLLLLVGLLSLPAVAVPSAAQDGPPRGWTVEAAPGGGVEIRWQLETPLPMRDARPEFRVGDTVIGYPRLERSAGAGTLVLVVDEAPQGALSVWLGSQRLDGPPPPAAFPVAPPDQTAPRSVTVLPSAADPAQRGPYETVGYEYELDPLPIRPFPAPIEVVGDVIAPADAPGARPLVLFLHGRHGTCFDSPDGTVTGEWPCPDGFRPIPSHLGYRYVAELLASQGYVTVSISANGINAQDYAAIDGGAAARSRLVRHHLELWADWNTNGTDPWGGVFEGKVDMSQVVLVGHSRGGEGVERAAVDRRADAPYQLAGLVAIGPTTFGRQVGLGLDQAVILPYCDGDVSDLQGQQLIDDTRDLGADSALRSSVLAMGANHNFFNTEWTPGLAEAPSDDDWLFGGDPADPTCGPASEPRLTPTEQQAVGATYIAALVHVAVANDAQAARLLDGSAVRAPSTGRAVIHTHALGGRRRLIYRPSLTGAIATRDLAAKSCRGWLPADFGTVSECAPTASTVRLPHWLPMFGAELAPAPVALDVAWRRAGGTVTVKLSRDTELEPRDAIDLRVAVDPAVGAARFALRLIDRDGTRLRVPGRFRVVPLPGTSLPLAKVWAYTARFPLRGLERADLRDIVGLELVARSESGHLWILDAAARRPGLAPTSQRRLPRVGVTRVRVDETDGPQQVTVPLLLRGRVRSRAVLLAQLNSPFGERLDARRVVIEPGETAPAVRLTVDGDDLFRPYLGDYVVVLKAITGVTTGRYLNALTVVEDDSPPELSFVATDPTVTEGESIVFRGSLSEPSPDWLFYSVELRALDGLPELYSDDVPEEWLLGMVGFVPSPPVPLRELVFVGLSFEPGQTDAEVVIPIAADGVAEGDEGVLGVVSAEVNPGLPEDLTAAVTVSDAP